MDEPGIVETRRAIEAILLVATDPTPASVLAQLLEIPVEHVELLCHALADSYVDADHGFELVQVAGGWRYQTHPDMALYVERFAMDGVSAKLSNAALETLAIVAYKQPISRAQVSAIRGVNVDAVLRTLVQRGYVEEIGRDTGAGQAVLFGTTPTFLERLGVNSLDDLPALGDFVPSAEVVEALVTPDPDPDPDPDPGPVAEAEPAVEPEPVSEPVPAAEPVSGAGPDPVLELDPVAVPEPEPEPEVEQPAVPQGSRAEGVMDDADASPKSGAAGEDGGHGGGAEDPAVDGHVEGLAEPAAPTAEPVEVEPVEAEPLIDFTTPPASAGRPGLVAGPPELSVQRPPWSREPA
jgi:segregation and condensation protein B